MYKSEESFFAFTAKRPVAIVMMVLAVITFGYISLKKLPVNLLPEIAYPSITVRTEYPGAGPEDVEERVSERVHEALSVLPGLNEISSISKPGMSDVSLEFAWDTNIAFATQNIREKLDRTFLPDDVETPIILRYDPSLDPVLRIGVTGGSDLIALRKITEDEIQHKLETVEGVAAVKVRGGLEEEIHVEVDEKKLRSLNLNISLLNQRLAAENVNMAAGTIKEGETEYLVRTLNQFMNLDDIMDLIISRSDAGPIRLGSLAKVYRTHKEQDVISRIAGKESVEIQVFKEADANIVTLADNVRARLNGTPEQQAYSHALKTGVMPDPELLIKEARLRKEKELAEKGQEPRDMESKPGKTEHDPHHRRGRGPSDRGGVHSLEKDPEILKLQALVDTKRKMITFIAANLPDNINIRILSDQSRFIDNSINEVKSSAILGGLFAVLILFLFLKKAGSTLIIALSIPISVTATFAPMFLTDTSLNIMSLGGLALGIGMLVDNSIIVLESIFRCREEGDSVKESAIRGVSEIGGAAVASTLTTVAVFFPIAFVEGIAGQIFRDQALTVVFSLLTSLAVALFFIPMLASRRFDRFAETGFKIYRFSCFSKVARFVKSGNIAWRIMKALLATVPFVLNLLVELAGFVLYHAGFAISWTGARIIWILLKLGQVVFWPLAFCFNMWFKIVSGFYTPLLRFILTNSMAIIILFAATFMLVYAGIRHAGELGQEVLPEVHQGELIAHLNLHMGAPLEQTDRITAIAEKESAEVDGVEWVSSTIGIARDEISSAEEGEHTARIYIKVKGGKDLEKREESVLEDLRTIYAAYPEVVSFRFTRPTLFSLKSPVQVEVKGIDLDEINEAAAEVEWILNGMEGLEDVKSTVQRGNPEICIRFDREKLVRYGLDTATLAEQVSSMVKGKVPTRFPGERKIDILVRVDQEELACVEDLAATIINPRSDMPLPLNAVADINVIEGPGEIRRIWGQRAGIVSANLSGFDMGKISSKIRAAIQPIQEKGNLTLDIGGQGRDLDSAMNNMMLALYLAIFLVYIVMASQFESLFQPFIIICSIPLAFVGVAFALYWLDIHLSVIVFIGGIMLAGIVVNNAIVLVDYINQQRRKGLDKIDAIVKACAVRLRPVLMTTATTVLGLLPLTGFLGYISPDWMPISLGIGEGLEIRAPMAITVISGLISSTVLTLIIIPVVYSLTDRVVTGAKELFTRNSSV